MSIDVYIPTPFRRATNNTDRVSVDALDAVLALLRVRRVRRKMQIRDEERVRH